MHMGNFSKSTELIFNYLFGIHSVPLRNETCKKENNRVNLVELNISPYSLFQLLLYLRSLSLCHSLLVVTFFFSFHTLNYESIMERSCWRGTEHK